MESESEALRFGFHMNPFGPHLEDGPVGQRMESGRLLATALVQAGGSEA